MNKLQMFICILLGLLHQADKLFAKKIIIIDYKTCFEKIRINDPNLKADKITIALTHLKLKSSKAELIPDLSVTSNYGLSWGTNFNPVTNQRSVLSSQNSSASASFQLLVYQNSIKRLAVKKAKNEISESLYQQKADSLDLALKIADLFYRGLYYKELLQSSKNLYSVSNKQVLDNQQRLEAGSIAKDDYLLSLNSALEDKDRVSSYFFNLKVITDELSLRMGFDTSQTSLELLSLSEENLVRNTKSEISLETNTPKYLYQQYIVNDAEIDYRLAKKSLLPQIFIQGGSSTKYDKQSTPFYGTFINQFQNNLGYYLAAGISFSITKIFDYSNKVNEARMVIERQNQVAEKISTDTKYEILNLSNELESKKLKTDNLFAIYKNYEKVFEMNTYKFGYGKISVVDYLQIKSRFLSAESEYVASKYEYILKSKALEQLYAVL